MEETVDDTVAAGMLERLLAATNQHDLEALVDCFADDYRNETPVHPARGFRGRAQVRRNWEQIFSHVPDVTAQVLRRSASGGVLWSEWELRGTRRDGGTHLMRGVILFGVNLVGVDRGRASWARFYLEPVDTSSAGVNAAVRGAVAPRAPSV